VSSIAGGPFVAVDATEVDIRLIIDRPGRSALELTALPATLQWVTAAVGGFAECSFQVPGDVRGQIPLLSLLRIVWGDEILYEGRIEDYRLDLTGGEMTTTVDCYGLRRRLEQTSVKRIWMKRDLNWALPKTALGDQLFTGGATSVTQIEQQGSQAWLGGQFDVTDLTLIGLRMSRRDETVSYTVGTGRVAELIATGQSLTALLGTIHQLQTGAGNGPAAVGGSSNGGATWASQILAAQVSGANDITTDFTMACVSGADRIRLGMAATPLGPANPRQLDFTKLRVLGAATTEDASGVFYGGTILRDLIGLVPELTAGIIEDGADFGIDQMDRSVRDSALSVVEEVTGYYQREWGVWESGRFDWKTHNLDEPQWMLNLSDLAGLSLTSTLDTLVRTIYLSYLSAIDLSSNEVTATSTDQRNPYVKAGQTKDAVIQAPFLMTPTTSQQLATLLARIQGGYPPVSGTVTLATNKMVSRNGAGKAPAYLIRGGDNILIGDLRKSDPLVPGRDGETLFHVASSKVDIEQGTVDLEVESQDKRADLLLARLAAATRGVTG
jgi:hypothetical protein